MRSRVSHREKFTSTQASRTTAVAGVIRDPAGGRARRGQRRRRLARPGEAPGRGSRRVGAPVEEIAQGVLDKPIPVRVPAGGHLVFDSLLNIGGQDHVHGCTPLLLYPSGDGGSRQYLVRISAAIRLARALDHYPANQSATAPTWPRPRWRLVPPVPAAGDGCGRALSGRGGRQTWVPELLNEVHECGIEPGVIGLIYDRLR